jgi:hypothetical protein
VFSVRYDLRLKEQLTVEHDDCNVVASTFYYKIQRSLILCVKILRNF